MKKLCSALMSIIFCFSMFGGTFACAPVAAAEETAAPERVGEVLTLREKNSDTYLLADGSYECVVYSQDKYFENDRGRLEEIDNSIVDAEYAAKSETYAYANKAGSVDYRFADGKAAVSIESGEAAIAFGIAGNRGAQARVGGDEKYEFDGFRLSGDNCVAYPDVAAGTDLVYAVKTGYLKEYIILKDRSASGEITFTFDADGLTAKPGAFGRVVFADKDGEPVFELENLFAIDSAGAYTEDLEYVIGETRDGKTDITVKVSEEYLEDADRVFPVLVDPTTTVSGASTTHDTYISEKNPTYHYYISDWLRTGWSSGFERTRSFLKFDIPSSVPSGSISGAYISLYKDSGGTPSIRAYRITSGWTDSNVTWNAPPSFATSSPYGTATLYSGNEYRVNISDLAIKWSTGEYSNYGVALMDSSEYTSSHYTVFSSTDAGGSVIPKLHITYNDLVTVDRMTSYYGDESVYHSDLQYVMNCYGYSVGMHCDIAFDGPYWDPDEQQWKYYPYYM